MRKQVKIKSRFWQILLPGLLIVVVSCVDQIDYSLKGNINTLVVDGRLTTADEEQTVQIYRAKSDEATGRFGSEPVRNISMELIVNATQTVSFTESTEQPGYYHLPAGFRIETGKSYQLRFRLPDGSEYESTLQKPEHVPAMTNVNVKFNPNEKAENDLSFTGFHEVYINTQDPAGTRNFYSWEWVLYEKQDWCKSCVKGVYAVNAILPGQYLNRTYFVSGNEPYEDCFAPKNVWNEVGAPIVPDTDWTYDYLCRTQCWQVFKNPVFNLFDDGLTDGGRIQQRKIARIPFYQHQGCLVELRQLSLDKNAYNYFRLFQQQTENNGGVADTPPTALKGNIRNTRNSAESVLGYFLVSDVSVVRYWIDRRDTGNAIPPGLFTALVNRAPSPEPPPPYDGPGGGLPFILISGGPPRVPTALCLKSDSRTPVKPAGWNDEK